jgi:beta-glucosidase
MRIIRIQKAICLFCLVIIACRTGVVHALEVRSPDGKLSICFAVKDIDGAKSCPVYSVSYKGDIVIAESKLGLELEKGPLKEGLKIVKQTESSGDTTWKPVYGERNSIRDYYNQVEVQLKEEDAPHRLITLTFRAYDQGVAFCYTIPKQQGMDRVTILRESTEFRFLADHTAWAVYSAQGNYEKVKLSRIKRGCERPLTIRLADDIYLALAEARLVDYARMKFAPLSNRTNSLVSELSGSVTARLPLTTPWRVVMVADSPGRLLENNCISLNLNAPCKIADTSWIKPGKVIREVTLTATGGKACVDFAARHNLQYVEFDAGWYGHEYSDDSDAATVNVDPKRSKGPLDLHEVIRYAGERGIGIILYVNRRALERQLDQILPLYRHWGVKGVKYGFVNVGSQKWTSWLHEAVRRAAENRLMVDVHDEYRPTGYSRTYPNLMTQEGIAGDETSPVNSLTLTILFTRMLAGAADNTICYYDRRVDRNATHAYQLAKTVCFYSPWQFLYWYDRPQASPQRTGGAGGAETGIGDEPELEFFDHCPTVWDDTKVLRGSIGEYAVIARRSGKDWFIGFMNSRQSRTFKVPLEFLDKEKKYIAHIYSDDSAVPTRTHVKIERFAVDSDTVLNMAASAKGGQAVRIVPEQAMLQTEIYLDPAQPVDKRVADLISRMTLEEKAVALFHNAPANERLHIPFWGGWNQCLHGVWSKQPTTLFPVSIAIAATWDPALVHTVADAISDEARALYNIRANGPHGRHGLVYRAPVINISRDPRWGRIQECYGEDPFLTSRIGVAYVQGLQGNDPKYLKVASTLKHFAVNNQERGRTSLSADVPERMLHEYWLPHFKACVVEGGARSLMAAYNAINDEPCAVNRLLLTDILRSKWGFDGFVVSDLGGIAKLVRDHRITTKPQEAVARALLAGCDYDDEQYRDAIPVAVREGLVSEEIVDRSLARVLRVAFRLGVFDPPEMVPYSKINADVIDSPKHRELALKTEREAIVLLSNKDGFLPLKRSKVKSVAVIGPMADKPEYGNYFGAAPRCVSPLQGLKNKLGDGAEVLYAKGCGVVGVAKPGDIDKAVETATRADVVILCLGTNGRVEAEGRDRSDLGLPGMQEKLLQAVCKANPKTILILFNAGPLSVKWARDNVPAIIEAWYPGEEGGNAITDVLFGDCNPGGKLPYTVYESVNQIPPQTEYDITKGFTYMYNKGRPLFPFGHGLSYTTFSYSNLKMSSRSVPANGRLTVSLDVRNTGDYAGNEVVQLYVRDVECSVKRPIKELRGFERIHLKPDETKTVILTLPAENLAFYDVNLKTFVVQPGDFEVQIGSSSEDIRLRGKFEVK